MTCAAHALARTRHMLTEEDVDLIRIGASGLRGSPTVVDLGAGSGTTAGAVFAERPKAIIATFDIDQANLDWAEKFIENIGHSENWAKHLMDSADAAEWWKKEVRVKVDYLLIDTSHEYGHTVDELLVWAPLMRKEHRVWLHDYVGDYPGVTRAVAEAVEDGRFAILKQMGLGVLGRFLR